MAGSGGANSPKSQSKKKGSSKDIGIQVDLIHSNAGHGRHSKWLWLFVLGVAVLASSSVYTDIIRLLKPKGFQVPGEMIEDLGMDGIILFKQHDRDDDGYLSLQEFEPLAHRIKEVNETFLYNEVIEEWDEVLTIETSFKPLQLHTMSKDLDLTSQAGPLDALHGLKSWKKSVREWQNIGASHLKPFLPTDPYDLQTVGKVYNLITMPGSLKGSTLSSNRYLPPRLAGDPEIMIHRLLNMFHPRPFVFSRFAPQGSVAIIRAANEKLVEVTFRIHAEFQLNEAPFPPFWFTPAQFMGHIIMSKDGTKVYDFHMYVPTDKRLNVDMEWVTDSAEQDNMEVDIGFMPQMELRSSRSSIHVFDEAGRQGYRLSAEPDDEAVLSGITWQEEISVAEARRRLEVEMYPFKQVEYYNFTTVFERAREAERPIHSILLWGALDDQSC